MWTAVGWRSSFGRLASKEPHVPGEMREHEGGVEGVEAPSPCGTPLESDTLDGPLVQLGAPGVAQDDGNCTVSGWPVTVHGLADKLGTIGRGVSRGIKKWSDRYCDEACAEYPSAANSARGASVQRERVSEGGTTG